MKEPKSNFKELFKEPLPLIGKIRFRKDTSKFACEETKIFEDKGFSGLIMEVYNSLKPEDLVKVIDKMQEAKGKLKLGLNILPNEYHIAIPLVHKFGLDFVHLDYVSGQYFGRSDRMVDSSYESIRSEQDYSNIPVIGGVWPKSYTPIENSKETFISDLELAVTRTDAVVVTPRNDIAEGAVSFGMMEEARKVLKDHPLIAAGLNPDDADSLYGYFLMADGAIFSSMLRTKSSPFGMLLPEKIDKIIPIYEKVKDAKYGVKR